MQAPGLELKGTNRQVWWSCKSPCHPLTPQVQVAATQGAQKPPSSWLGLLLGHMEGWANQACWGFSDKDKVTADCGRQPGWLTCRWVAPLSDSSLSSPHGSYYKKKKKLCCLSCMSFFSPSFCPPQVWPLPLAASLLLFLGPYSNPLGL